MRGAWIEMQDKETEARLALSHPVRGAWIEIQQKEREAHAIEVAPREGCVD